MEAAIEAGAEDVESDEEGHTLYAPFEGFSEVADAVTAKLGAAQSSKIVWRPKNWVPVEGETAESVIKMLEALEEDDDVQNVFANADLDEGAA
jgi:transcriptional/translational regulatory protein YebC/TACO1